VLVALGGFEFDVVDLGEASDQKKRFMTDCYAPSELPTAGDVVNFHAHFVLVARVDGAYLDARAVGTALRFDFPRRHQVMIEPPWSNQSYHVALTKTLSYPLKSFSNFSSARVQELATGFAVVSRRDVVYEHTRGLGARRLATAPTMSK
jgi:hypothetical protein